ncbi:hypothetical protein F3Y22_tig00111640pilonHSYRG00021 [Hibiscus syriacus]|uniref:Reverse transcriptase zinc-binding domain-containing protein n=1 Tax=Hibiscus syriacus TaxID=106335 RepID=A0A6A2XZ80_HIBSY|nr:hypothetical protein F3Y22_tig00111640pilonHSYRG00021 [Hibiscus syriacus]
MEIRDHLFFECKVSQMVWKCVLTLRQVSRTVMDWDGELQWACSRIKDKSLRAWALKLAWNCYGAMIWKARNQRLFAGMVSTISEMVDRIKQMIRLKLWDKHVNVECHASRGVCIA